MEIRLMQWLPLLAAILIYHGCDSGTDSNSGIGSITSPVEGAKFLSGDSITVSWSGASAAVLSGGVSGGTPTPLEAALSGPGTLKFSSPEIPTDLYTIRVTSAADPADMKEVTVSLKHLLLLKPEAGSVLTRGQGAVISWRVKKELGSPLVAGVLVYASTNSGGCYALLSSGGMADPEEDYVWTAGQEVADPSCVLEYPSTQVFIRIADYFNQASPGKFDISSLFTVN